MENCRCRMCAESVRCAMYTQKEEKKNEAKRMSEPHKKYMEKEKKKRTKRHFLFVYVHTNTQYYVLS